MKLFFLLSLLASVILAVPMVNKTTSHKAINKEYKLSPPPHDWFKQNLDIDIPEQLIKFSDTCYMNYLSPAAKKELWKEEWLGSKKDVNSVEYKYGVTIVDLSSPNLNKSMYIIPQYFVLSTSTLDSNRVTVESSLIYFPKTNTVKKVNYFFATSIEMENIIMGRMLSYSEDEGYNFSEGYYDPYQDTFVSNYK